MTLYSELRRREVLKVLALYVAGSGGLLGGADLFFPGWCIPDSSIRHVWIAVFLGLPLALVFSWYFDLSQAGVRRTLRRGGHVAHRALAKTDIALLSVLGILVIGIIGIQGQAVVATRNCEPVVVAPPPFDPPEGSVAVLPFVAISSGEDDGYFADGLTVEILTSLAQFPELRVPGRTSVFFFKDKEIPLRKIADLLGVAYIVEGSVRRDGQQLRITSQLIRGADGFQLWSQTYDRASEERLAIQQDIAEKVAEALGVALDDEARKRMLAMQINNVDAFIAYQKGLDFFEKAHSWDLPLIEGLTAANEYFDKALEAQPDLHAARVLRADRAGHIAGAMIRGGEPDLNKVKAQVEAYRSELAYAWRSMPNGNQRDILNLERILASDDWTGLSAAIQRAMRPGGCPRMNSSERIAHLGFAQELASKLEESLACNPLDADVIVRLAEAYSFAGRPDDALQLLDRAEAMGVNGFRIVNYARRLALTVAGRFDDPLQQWDLKQEEWLWSLYQGDQAEARQIAEQIWSSNEYDPFHSLRLAAFVGDRVRANKYAAHIDKYPASATTLLRSLQVCMIWGRAGIARGCRNGVPFDLEATSNFKAHIEESGLPWPPMAFRDISTEAL